MDVEETTTYVCSVELALSAIAGKWKPAILWELSAGPKRFGELQATLIGISHKVLSQQLTQLHRDGMVERGDAGGDAMGYTLTTLGGTLRPALNALAQWGKEHGAMGSQR
ncbi:helix-turn-helix domain-containing protein [Dyella sp. GSA-30]|uniref:winged helix-turn-helix transcriptional regulator n=1 Tax=Dyella sp. GSA-30 TaxID=2994496 RepID=UPI0024932EAE|nr:helix-turn-helix domain-containing protein [Dyella sp. GSA-30]BDU19039.1 HxlR family transcriptional regulator [Dyella sp. GSA-30]